MLFKLALKNIKKSIKDYAIYFLTLVLGVAIFYMFNSLDSQQAMLRVSASQREIIKLMITVLGFVSVFVAIVLGLLIVYANNFLINRRKKEFAVYMTLGMGRRQISKIILIETVFIGIISLLVGIVFGVFVSQFMSILVAKLFQADMSEYTFIFSKEACIKTCIYFAIMYVADVFFSLISISRYKLINLLNANKKNEKVKLKNPILCVIIFLVSIGMLTYSYYKVSVKANSISTEKDALIIIIIGVIATILFFWSLSGFILNVVKKMKNIYLKGTNMFVLRQLNNKINTTVLSISIICIMLFMTITILSLALSLRNTMEKELKEMTPVDINLYKTAYLPEKYTNRYGKEIYYTKEQIEDSKLPITETLKNNGFDMNYLKDIVEISIYASNDLTWKDFFGDKFEEIKSLYPGLQYGAAEEIIKISDYNRVAKLYGIEQYELKDNEYIMLCDFKSQKELRDKVLKDGSTLEIAGKQYKSKYNECQSGYVFMSTSHVNTGIILVPDNCNLANEDKEKHVLVGNYNANSQEDKEAIEYIVANNQSGFIQNLYNSGIELDGMTKITIFESSIGLVTMVIFIAIYLGIIFLIASSAILALKQLTESSDNKQRYSILRKIGADEKMINRALLAQIGIFFSMPLILAMVHSIFGIKFGVVVMSGLASAEEILPSIIVTVSLIGVIYGLYFLATYYESKRIIKDE